MLFQERIPEDLPSKVNQHLQKALKAARLFFESKEDRSQKRFEFSDRAWTIARPYVESLFANTCAFCECEATFSPLEVEQFRPRSEAVGLDGTAQPDCYWWLAYEWENLYLVCQACNFQKKNYFPIVGKRARPGTLAPSSLKRERPILLDPCNDEPARHLRFEPDGFVRSITPLTQRRPTDPDRGAITIDILALNRTELVVKRQIVYSSCTAQIRQLESIRKIEGDTFFYANLLKLFEKYVDQWDSFVALKRQLVARYLITHEKVNTRMRRLDLESHESVREQIEVELDVEGRQSAVPFPSPTKVAPEGRPVPTEIQYDNLYIKHVAIHNFKSITNFRMSLPEAVQTPADLARGGRSELASTQDDRAYRASWKMFLGDNATGKSSILKALAIALMGEKECKARQRDYRLKPDQLFNRRTRQRSGYIIVELSRGEPIHISLSRSEVKFVSGAEGAKGCFVRGFGSARLFSLRQSPQQTAEPLNAPLKDVDNLFNPGSLLPNPERWLLAVDKRSLSSTGLVLRDLFDLPDRVQLPLRRQKGRVLFDPGSGHLPLVDQSDGYNSMLAMVIAILAGLPPTLHDKRKAAGILLIDEIESHLHPRWKASIVGGLRATFPNMQVITSTHDPLCLRGLASDEVSVLDRRQDGELRSRTPEGDISTLRIDQLLTSPLFGLLTTFDRSVEEGFQKYYKLLAGGDVLFPTGPDQETQGQLRDMEDQLAKFNELGDMPRDRLAYRIIDEYISRETELASSLEPSPELEFTKARVMDLWSSVTPETDEKG